MQTDLEKSGSAGKGCRKGGFWFRAGAQGFAGGLGHGGGRKTLAAGNALGRKAACPGARPGDGGQPGSGEGAAPGRAGVQPQQGRLALGGVSAEELARVIIAYEPVWAIGTGRTATAAQANEVCALIRDTVAQLYSWDIADDLVIQYGGSMNAGNAAELLAQPDVDGGLIGGASLKPADFAAIVYVAK